MSVHSTNDDQPLEGKLVEGTKSMTTHRESPPTLWASGAVEIDAEVGVYLSPTLRRDTQNPTFWHWCTKLNVSPRWVAMGTGIHTVISNKPYTLSPSLLCSECGLHGFIQNGKWVKV